MSDPLSSTHDTQTEAPDSDSIDQSRRKLTGATLGVSAAVLTLASRPVLAQECLSPSGFASGNLSPHGTPVSCSGNSPARWVVLNPSFINSTKFSDIFADVAGRVEWGNAKFKQVMQNAATDASLQPNPISAEFAAALMNIRAGGYPAGLDETALIGMWTEFASTGSYEVTAGVFWNAAQIVSYLQYLRTPV